MACATIQNMGIYDRCEKDVKNCRPHSLKPEEGLLTIDKDFLSLFVCIHLRPKGTKSQRQWKCWIAVHEAVHVLERLCLLFILLFVVYITLHWSSYILLISACTVTAFYCLYYMFMFIVTVYDSARSWCYNLIKLISILDIIAHNFHFYVAFCSPWWKIEISQRNKLP